MKDLDDLEPLEKRLKKKVKELRDVDAKAAGMITTFEIEPAEGELLDKYAIQLGTSRKVAGMYDGTDVNYFESDWELRQRLKALIMGNKVMKPIFENQEEAKRILKEISKL